MKIYIIIISPESNKEIFSERIKMIGSNYIFWDNHWLVSSNQEAKEIYKKISAGEFKDTSILVTEFNIKNYYGRMNTSLWDWIKSESKK